MEQSGGRSRVLCWELMGLGCFAGGDTSNQGKSREIKGKQGKSREIKGKQGESRENKGKQGKTREIKGNQEESRGSRGVKGIKVNRGKTR